MKCKKTEEGRAEETVINREADSSLQQISENLSTECTEKVKTSQFKNNKASNL